MKAYVETVDQVVSTYQTNLTQGLSSEEVQKRLVQYGANELVGKKNKNFIQKFIEQLKDVMVIVLLIAAAISFVLAIIEGHGEYIDSIIILLIVILNAVLGVVQESNAEKALDALKSMSAPSATVVRDGTATKIPSKDIVPGDVIQLEAGDLIPADARLFENASLKSEESALTGESVPVDKNIHVEVADDSPLGDRLNMVYSGCSITYGRAKAIVVDTGMNTEMGKIAGLLNETEAEDTPLQLKLNRLGKMMGLMALVICILVFLLGILKGESPIEMFLTAVSLAVAAIPEGLATVVTLVLAMGVQKMVKENAIIRRLPAVETLGSTSVICSDKTGTLTQNKMTVKKVWTVNGSLQDMSEHIDDHAKLAITYNAICNDSSVKTLADGTIEEIGDPTETALVAAAQVIGLEKEQLDATYKRVGEIPFDSERKLMSTINVFEDKIYVVVKGGYDVLVSRCHPFDTAAADAINMELGSNALRVLAVAYKEITAVPDTYDSASLESDLTFIGLVGMIDPPRKESKDAIATCKKAGIRTVMITGDHVITATAIAKELGIIEEGQHALSGHELALIDEQTLIQDVRKYSVYARVSPEDKIRIVKAWQANGEVVAMTGDGVNDAPALNAANIGCAMGITGTEVAKGAAAMVLTDDNFSTIVSAVKEGRTIYANIKKTIEFLLGSNIGEVLVVFTAMLLGWGTPLVAIQLLMINVVTDAFPAFALGFEKSEPTIMRNKPTPRDEGVFANGLGTKILLQGIAVAVLTLTAFYFGKYVMSLPAGIMDHFDTVEHASEAVGRTMAFLTLTLSQLVHAYNCRTNDSVFKIGVFTNKTMNYAFIGSFAIAILISTVPFLEEMFGMVNLDMAHWLLVAALSISILVIVEIGKLTVRLLNKEA